MQVRFFSWLEREFVEIAAESRAGVAADIATDELFRAFDDQLRARLVARSCGARPRVGKKQGRSHVSDGSAVEDSNWRAKSRQLQFHFAAVVRLGRDRGSGA